VDPKFVKRFVFKLQTALDVRAQKVDALKAKLAEVNHQRLALVQRRDAMVRDMQHASQQRQQNTPLALQLAQQWPAVQEQLGRAIAECRQQEVQLNQVILHIQQLLQQAVKDHKALDTLKTQQTEAHKRAVLAQEEATLADITQSRYGRF
jgi:flagellar export protein FliJ